MYESYWFVELPHYERERERENEYILWMGYLLGRRGEKKSIVTFYFVLYLSSLGKKKKIKQMTYCTCEV